jgi:hypothetical protein
MMMTDDPSPNSHWSAVDAPHLQCVDYEQTLRLDPTAAPEKQAKIALDGAITSGNADQVQLVLTQIAQHIPQRDLPLMMMHALRSAAKMGNVGIMQLLLAQIQNLEPQQVFDVARYGLDGAASQSDPAVLDFLLGVVQKVFQAAYPQQFLQLLQHAINAVAERGNLILLKFLMDHTAAASIPINYDNVFTHAASKGHAETLLKEAIGGGSQYENVIMMLLESARNLPDDKSAPIGSRQSIKNTAKFQLVKSYKQSNPELFARLMAAVKSYFPEEANRAPGGVDGDIAM